VTATAAPAATGRLYVGSEVGALRRVVLHRPDLELRRLTPANKDELLFDDVIWVTRAREEHDAFADALRERGVEVLYLQDLLAETLAIDGVRGTVVQQTLRDVDLGPRLRHGLGAWLDELPAERLAQILIGGVALDELPFASGGLAAAVDRLALVLPPLPNHLFTRDTSCWIYGGVSVNHMLVCVVPPPVALGPWAVEVISMNDSERSEYERVEALAAEALRDLGALANAHVVEGRPDIELAARSSDLDLLVVGSRGYGPLKRLLLGSTSSKLVRSAACPVIVLPRAAHEVDTRHPTLSGAERA
jgi:nucleotide-binding universal stress UspA family protein